jgi:hypothetical protein
VLLVKPEATLYVVVGSDRIDCGMRAGGAWIDSSVRHAVFEHGDGLTAAVDAIGAAQGGPVETRPRQVRVIVADLWLASATMPWSSEQRGDGARRCAIQQLADGGAVIGDGDSVRIDAAPAGQPRLIVAYPEVLVAALERLAHSAGAPLASVLPYSWTAWDGDRGLGDGTPRALGLCDRRMLLVCHGEARLAAVTTRASATADIAGLLGLWGRMQLREPRLASMPAPRCVDLAALTPHGRLQLAVAVARHASALDAVPHRPRAATLRWMAAMVAICCAAAIVAQAAHQTLATQALRQQWAALAPLARPVPAARTWQRDELEHVRAVNRAVASLNLPVADLLRALHPPPDIGALLLSVELTSSPDSARAAVVRIQAETRNGAEMARYVAFVAGQKPFHGATLLEHEVSGAATERTYRFTLEAQWAG